MTCIRWGEIAVLAVVGTTASAAIADVSSLQDQFNAVSVLNGNQPITDLDPSATADDPSGQAFTTPSLWWQQQQQGDAINRRLIDTWKAYDRTVSPIPHVDVFVNGQIWPLLTYLEQYAFMTQFGESAKGYGYQLRIFIGNRQVGLHVCDFLGPASAGNGGYSRSVSEEPSCRVELDYFGQGAIRGREQR